MNNRHPISETINRTVESVSDLPPSESHRNISTETAAEEFWAMWRDFRPLQLKKDKNEAEKAREQSQLAIIAKQWRNPKIRQIVEATLREELHEKDELQSGADDYNQIKNHRDEHEKRRLDLFRSIFKSGGAEESEFDQIELAELEAKIKVENNKLASIEAGDPELAAHLSFERLRRYQRELAKGFIWTPSRHRYFNELLQRAVILNQNRPILMYGESGTGKTRLIREIAKRLTGEAPFEVGEEAKSDIRPLLGSKKIDAAGNYITYGPLAKALIGKQTSRDETVGSGGIFYMDEMNGYPSDGLRALIKQISGLKSGDTVSFATWEGRKEKVAPGFMFVGSANLLSEKHRDRPDLPNELKRELAPSSFEVDYPPQKSEDPEFFEMCLAALMDKNGRVRAEVEDLAPRYTETVDTDKNLITFNLDTDKNSGGALWRFAQMVAEIQRCYKLTEGSERIDGAPFDPGVAFAWLTEYRKSASHSGEYLQNFLVEKLNQWVGGEVKSGQKLFSAPDIKRLKEIFAVYGLDKQIGKTQDEIGNRTLTSLDIGRLSPRVPRPPERLDKEIQPKNKQIYFIDGTTENYLEKTVENFVPGTIWKTKDSFERVLIFKGIKTDNTDLIFEDVDGLGQVFTIIEAKNELEKQPNIPAARESLKTKEVRELFGKNFFGIEQVEQAFTIKDAQGRDIKLIDLSPKERQDVTRMLEAKLSEPDIRAFLAKPENKKDIKNGKYLFILRVPFLEINSQAVPLTMENLQTQISPDMDAKNQGKLFYSVDWYQDENFYKKDIPDFQWALVTKEVVNSTLGLKHQLASEALTVEAIRTGLDKNKIKRRQPVETVYDFRVVLGTIGERILLNRWDWSNVRSSGGNLVYVGHGDSGGLNVRRKSPGDSDGDLGASLSR